MSNKKIIIKINGDEYRTTIDEYNRSGEGECQTCGGEFKSLIEWLMKHDIVDIIEEK